MQKYLFLIIFSLVGCNSGDETAPNPPSETIFVYAGEDISTQQSIPVTLTGTVSGSGLITTLWSQVSGRTIEFTETQDPPSITFMVPDVGLPETLVFRLSAVDADSNFQVDDVAVNIELQPHYIKYDSTGALPDSATEWDCVAYEPYPGMIDAFYTTLTYNTDAINFNLKTYTWANMAQDLQALNDSNFCGFNDWVVVSNFSPYTKDNDYFPYSVEIWLNLGGTTSFGMTYNEPQGFVDNKLKIESYNVRYARYL